MTGDGAKAFLRYLGEVARRGLNIECDEGKMDPDDERAQMLVTMRVRDSVPIPGAKEAPCSFCDQACVISPLSFKVLDRGLPVICIPCARKKAGRA